MCKQVCNTLLANAVLCHLDRLDALVGCVRFGPGLHAAVLEAVAAADYELEVRHVLAFFARSVLLAGERREGVGEKDAGRGTHAIVVQV